MSLSHRLPPGAAVGDPYYVYAPRPDPQRQGVLHALRRRPPRRRESPARSTISSPTALASTTASSSTPAAATRRLLLLTFFTHESALSAMTSLNGTVFDPETGDRLHIELAKSTSRRPRGGGDIYRVIDKRANRTEGNADHENIGDEEAWGEDEDGDSDNNGQHYYLYSLMNHLDQPRTKQQNGQSPSNDGRDKSSSDIPPCSTLFIANLGHACTEDELKEVLSKYDA
ncbi:hypothetical protein HU200_003970 [Digitaria exilis]|uniref:RRM domain-containing protein n=1 Tax=Digitaria exilis TaxID=1010633 RepID=A0A835KU70_9POAL|nr:hypothetical protein HU200_003970 [Digitaria exilis]